MVKGKSSKLYMVVPPHIRCKVTVLRSNFFSTDRKMLISSGHTSSWVYITLALYSWARAGRISADEPVRISKSHPLLCNCYKLDSLKWIIKTREKFSSEEQVR